mmetsp:Transcript_24843/g.52948  ORF Transcript_24843/g.52948 Transcript_24843/m.52948 type:complete len:100 (-) Transcript_24843:50-349(-)
MERLRQPLGVAMFHLRSVLLEGGDGGADCTQKGIFRAGAWRLGDGGKMPGDGEIMRGKAGKEAAVEPFPVVGEDDALSERFCQSYTSSDMDWLVGLERV